MSLHIITSLGGTVTHGDSGDGGGTPQSYWGVALTDGQILEDDGLYNGFPMSRQVLDGRKVVFYKKSADHGSAGAFMCKRSTLVPGVFEQQQTTVGGVPLNSAAHSWQQHSNGMYVIAYQDDELYTSIKLAKSADPFSDFTQFATIDTGVDYSSSPSPIMMIEMPDGTLYFVVYRYGLGANPALVQIVEIPSTLDSYTMTKTIHTGTEDYPTDFPNWKGHEAGVCIVENTGVNATCKLLCWIRTAMPHDGGTYPLVKTSVDGGATWQFDLTEDSGAGGPYSRALNYNFVAGNAPYDIILHEGLVYIGAGVRAVDDYYAAYVTGTPAVALANQWNTLSAIVRVENFNATTLGSSIDAGYCIWHTWKMSEDDPSPQLWMDWYDVSTEPMDPGITADRCWIKQVKIAD